MPLQYINRDRAVADIEDSALIRLVYVSSLPVMSRFNNSLFADISKAARAYNAQHGITGILCYGNGYFLQCIEGTKTDVLVLKQRIFSDRRHKDFKILLLKAIDERSFIDWRMRLLFLERWLWSPTTKEQATQLASFLPFAPYKWKLERTEQFLQTITTFYTTPHIKTAGINYSALANMFRHVIGPHQAFLAVQTVLSLLIVVAILLLFL